MSMFTTFIQKEAQLKTLEAELASMKADTQLQKEIEFKEKLEALMEKHDASKESVLKVVAPELFIEQSEKKKTRKPRKLKIYKNPHTGEVVETRGGNHSVLKAWKKEHGGDTVEGWLIDDNKEQKAPVVAEAKEATTETVVEAPVEAPVEAKKEVAEKKKPANTKAQKSDTAKTASATKQKRDLPIGMKPMPKGHQPKFKFTPKAKASR